MTLRKKILLTALFMIPLCAFAFIGVCYQVILNGFGRIESQNSQSHMHLVLRTIGNELSNIGKIELQLSASNATYQFVSEKHAGDVQQTSYIQDNYPKEQFTNNQFNVILIFDANGKLVYGQAYNFNNDGFVPLPADLLQQVQTDSAWLQYPSPTLYKTGFIPLREGPLMVVGQPIVKNSYQGPIHGTMMIGRFLDQSQINLLSDMTGESISIRPFDRASVPFDPASNQTGSSGISHSPAWIDRTNTSVLANTVIYGIDQTPAFVVQVADDRSVYGLGKITVRDVAYFICTMLVVLTLLVVILLEKAVFLRLRRFNERLQGIQKTGDLSSRVYESGHDEIATLAQQFNHMMSSLEQSQKTILRQARFDALTGLPNRYELYKILEHSIETSSRNRNKLAVLFIDLDNFKAINDSFGHDIGDLLLKSVTGRLRTSVGKQGMVARLAGDEFVVLLHSVSGAEMVEDVAKTILDALDDPVLVHHQQIFVNASIGGSIFPIDGQDTDSLLRHADIAMYYAKKDGQNNFRLITEEMKGALERTRRLERDLKTAIDQQQMYLVYQPKVDARTGQIIGIEALARWNHPELGHIPPSDFIYIAESTGMITTLGAWVMKTACSQNLKWIQEGHMSVPVSVNVSPVQFAQDHFTDVVKGVLTETGLPAAYLELEVTESIAMRKVERVTAKLQELKRLGLIVSVDDFGVGYSSLNYLKSLPVDTVKIDRSFIHNVSREGEDRTIVQAIIDLAHRLQMTVIAEGVETLEQFQFLKDNQCDMIQGYLFSKPVPADQMGHVLKQGVIQPV